MEFSDEVHAIEELDPDSEYEVQSITITHASGLKLSNISFQSFRDLKRISIQNYQGDPQIFDFIVFENLEKINYLNLAINKIEMIENTANECVLSNIESFDLSENQLTSFDMGVIKCSSKLISLDLSENNIITLENSSPGSACFWPALDKIRLSKNKLISFDGSFFSCSNKLIELGIYENKLTTFGDWSSCYWPNLENLVAFDNKLINFNQKILKCSKRIKSLQLSNNKLKAFGTIGPKWGCAPRKFEYLDLSQNELSEIDLQQFRCAKKLKGVDLRDNKLSNLSFNLSKSNFPDLLEFDITKNPWQCQSLEKIESDLRKMTYYNDDCSGKSIDGIGCY